MDTALQKAAEKGDTILLQELVSLKANIIYDVDRHKKNTALHIAASKGHTWFVHYFLLLMGMNVQLVVSKNLDGDTPLHLAVREGHLEVVKHLSQYLMWARGVDANLQRPTVMTNRNKDTPLHDASLHRQSDIALELLELNPGCAHALNVKMQSPLYIAAREGLLQVVKKIADQGVSTISASTTGTALHQAVLDDNFGK